MYSALLPYNVVTSLHGGLRSGPNFQPTGYRALLAYPATTLWCAATRPAQQQLPHRGCMVISRAKDDDDGDDEPMVPGKPMRVERLLANLGYGKRRECAAMIKKGFVLTKSGDKLKAGDKVLYSDLVLENGEPLDPPPPIVIMLHKPTGYVTTSPEDKAISDPVVYDLLPYRFSARRPFLAPVGRLDKDTSGLLLLTDDGQLLHRINSPKRGIWKVYEAELAAPLTGKAAEAAARKFASGGLVLEGDNTPLLPARLAMLGDTTARIAICEGRYHQVRRMFAAVGNEVVTLHRASVGGISLAGSLDAAAAAAAAVAAGEPLPEGEWRYLSAQEVAAVFNGPDHGSDEEGDGEASGAASTSTRSGGRSSGPRTPAALASSTSASPSGSPDSNSSSSSRDQGGASSSGSGSTRASARAVDYVAKVAQDLNAELEREQEALELDAVPNGVGSMAIAAAADAADEAGAGSGMAARTRTLKRYKEGERLKKRRDAVKKSMPSKL